MKRIIMHWTAGAHKANNTDLKHYHRVYEKDGKMVPGVHLISANTGKLVSGKYAAHTLNCNTDSIGLSMACMFNATEKDFGTYPMTEAQFEAMCKDAAALCVEYGIKVTNKTVLSHAEVQPNLGITQKGKWDFTVLPFNGMKGAKTCGDYARKRVQAYIDGAAKTPVKQPDPVKPEPKPEPKPEQSFWQWLLSIIFGVGK